MKLKHISQNKESIKLRKVIKPPHIAKYAKALTKNNKDCVLTISGKTGEGKSVLAVHIAKGYDKRFQYDRNLIYSRKELHDKIETFPPSAFIIDEAINVLYKREWNKGTQKDLIKLLNICRSKGHLLIFVQPAFTDMDKDIRRERIRLWLYAEKRGVGIVLRPIKSIGGEEDPWNLKEMDANNKKFIRRLGEFYGTLEGTYRSHNFLNFIKWDDLPKDEYELYNKVKDEKKFSDEKESLFSEKDVDKKVREKCFELLELLKNQQYLKKGFYQTVATFFGITVSAVSLAFKKTRVETKGLNNNEDIESEDTIKI